MAQWTWLNPKPSGYDNQKIVFTNPNNGYILNGNGELLKTANRGESWQLSGNFINAICLDIKDSTGVIGGYSGTIYLSTNNGDSWTQMYTGINDAFTFVNIVSRDTFFLSNRYQTAIYRTTDRGKTWKTIRISKAIYSMCFVNSSIGYIGSSMSTIIKTTDGGATWKELKKSNTTPTGILSLQFLSADTGFAYMERYSLLRTYDGGTTWQQAETQQTAAAMHFVNPLDGYLGGSYSAIYATHDGGKTFTSIGENTAYVGNDINSVLFLSKDTGFAVGSRGKILKTVNAGLTWSAYSSPQPQIADLVFPEPSVGYAASFSGVYKTIDNGQSWNKMNVGIGSVRASSSSGFERVHFYNKDTGFAMSSYPTELHRTFNGGQTWDTTYPIYYTYDYTADLQFISPKVGFMSWIIYGNQGAILKTTDAGMTWQTVWQARYMGERFDRIFFLNADTGFAINYNTLYKTTDAAQTWTPVKLTDDSYQLTGVVFTTGKKGFVTDDNGNIYVTNDGGATWVRKFQSMYSSTGTPAMKFVNPRIGFMSTGYRIGSSMGAGTLFKTVDSGNTWLREKNIAVKTITFSPDNSVFISAPNGALLTSKLVELAILPVKMSSLAAAYSSRNIKVTWTTEPDPSADYFVVEKSSDAFRFLEAGRVKARQGSAEIGYQFLDTTATDLNYRSVYYRLRAVTQDGESSLSKVVKVDLPAKASGLRLYPNPASSGTRIQLMNPVLNPSISAYNERGERVYYRQLTGLQNSIWLSTAGFASGRYTIMLEAGKTKLSSQLILAK